MPVRKRLRIDAGSVWAGTLGSRLLRWVVVLTVVLVVVLDAGSVFMTRISLSDDGQKAGREAAKAASGLPLNSDTAVTAFDAAQVVTAEKDGETVRQSDFLVKPGGRVRLTVERTAPSLVLGRVPWLAHFGEVAVTVEVEKPVM